MPRLRRRKARSPLWFRPHGTWGVIGPSDHLGWAKKPKSREAIERIKDLSTRDRRFISIWRKLVDEGIATETGRPIVLWDGTQWVKL